MQKLDLDAQKKALRKIYKEKRLQLDPFQKSKKDRAIATFVFSLPEYQKAEILFLYASTEIEIDTYEILENALTHGKKVAFPRCVAGTRNMEFYCIQCVEELQKGAYGILEPKANLKNKIENFNSGLCIVPALCYDREGYRLGYGGGYYDRFLQIFKGDTVGLTYENCFVDALLRGPHDCAVHSVITEKQILRQ